jgi:hypothetical protein
MRGTMVRVDERTLGKLNDLQERIEAENPGRREPRQNLVRQLLARAMADPKILRAVGVRPASSR